MAAELVTPTDSLTGLPHIVLPYDPEPGTEFSRIDYHHHFSPRRALVPKLVGAINTAPLAEDLTLQENANLALRMSRGQLLAREIHEASHRKYLGPVLPETVDETFITTVKACSGIVSRLAIDLRIKGDDQLVRMDDVTFNRVTSRRVLCTERMYYDRPADYRRHIIGNFFVRYAIEQNLSQLMSGSVIDQFLTTPDENRKKELGNLMIKTALEAKIAPVEAEHRQLRRRGMVQPGRPDLKTSVKKFLRNEILPDFYPALESKLLTA